jgi:hypothetical protein
VHATGAWSDPRGCAAHFGCGASLKSGLRVGVFREVAVSRQEDGFPARNARDLAGRAVHDANEGESRLQKTLVVVLLVTLGGTVHADAQSVFPLRLDEVGVGDFEPLTSLGDNGKTIDDCIVTVTSTAGACLTSAIGTSVVNHYCGDDNGCTARLLTRYSQFVPQPPAGFALDPGSCVWRVSRLDVVDGLSYFSGIHTNDVQANVLETSILTPSGGTLDICAFFDDYVPCGGPFTGYFFRQRACWAGDCGNTSCTLIIED